jgi:hypothetical protein
LCLDAGTAKKGIVEKLRASKTPFIDVGMGVELVDGKLRGILRVTAVSPEMSDAILRRIPMSGNGGDNIYDRNIQVADLNAEAAFLAVLKFKKIIGFYDDLENENLVTYTIDGNEITNEHYA